MERPGSPRPRRLIDDRYDFAPKHKYGISFQAERILVLRLLEGVPVNYLTMAARAWRARVSINSIDQPVGKWYKDIQAKVDCVVTMKEFVEKAAFYRERWETQQGTLHSKESLEKWLTRWLATKQQDENGDRELGCYVKHPVGNDYAEDWEHHFRPRYNAEKAWRDRAKDIYIRVTQPEVYESWRNQAADEEKERRDIEKEPERLARAEDQQRECRENEEHANAKAKAELDLILGKGKKPVVWDWEK